MKKKLRRVLMGALAVLFVLTVFLTTAYFSDRKYQTAVVTTPVFAAEGYRLESEHPTIPFVAGEDIELIVTESGDESLRSFISMSAKWVSPDVNSKVYGNEDPAKNLIITMEGASIIYNVEETGEIRFTLPSNQVLNDKVPVSRSLMIHIPEELISTGELFFTFEEVYLQQFPTGFSHTIERSELESQNFSVNVGWVASSLAENNGKNLMGFLIKRSTQTQNNSNINLHRKFCPA